MSFGEILDAAMTLFGRNFLTFFGTITVCLGVFSVLNVLLNEMVVDMSTFSEENLGEFLLLLAALAISYFIGSLLAAGAIVKIISEQYLGQDVTVGDAIRFAAGKFWRLFAAGLAKNIVIFLAMLLLIIPGIVVWCGYAVVSQVVVLEQLNGATDALGRSWQLTKGFKWRALGLMILASLIAGVPGSVPDAIGGALPDLRTPMLVIGQIAKLALMPVLPCVLTVFYYDLRVRKEAFDLQLLSQQLGTTSA